MDALRKYNEGSDKWCIPRKGSADYLKIREMMKKISSIQKSKSKDSSKEDLVDKNRRIQILQAAIKRRLVAKAMKSISERKSPREPAYNSESRAFSSDYYKNQKATKIQKFLRDKLIVNKNNLDNRVKTFKIVSKRLASIKPNDCLEKKTFDGVAGYTIRNVINLEKQIGTPSKNGAIYLTSIPNFLGIHPIASKVMKVATDNIKEVKLMTQITKEILLKKMSRHFLMIYGSCNCSKEIAEKLRYLSINELADGDLKMLINNKDVVSDAELLFNIFIQTFISIATFQNIIRHVHKDLHYGNFLFQTNNDKGYYHYIFNGNSYYLKACKYNIIIYDYGYAKPIVKPKKNTLLSNVNNQTRSITFDYSNIIHSFMNSKYYGYVNFPNLPPEPMSKNIFAIFRKIQEISAEEVAKNMVDKSDKQYENTIFQRIIEEIFKYAPKNMFITKRPPNVINKTPFYISPPNHVAPKAASATSPASSPKPVVKKAAKPAKAASATKSVDSRGFTKSFKAAAMLMRKEEYVKFVKEMRVKVKKNFPDLTPDRVMAKVKDLWKTHIRRKDALSTDESVRTPSPLAKPVKKPAKAAKAAKAAKPTQQYVNSTESNIAAAILKRKKDYKKFVKEMRVKVKEDFPYLTVAKVMAKVKDLWKTHMRKQEGLSTNASIYTPSK